MKKLKPVRPSTPEQVLLNCLECENMKDFNYMILFLGPFKRTQHANNNGRRQSPKARSSKG
jgi:hypothetical protein